MIQLLLALSVCFAQGEFETPLIQAVNDGSVVDVQKLAKDKTELAKKDSSGYDALFHAVSINDLKKVEALLKAGASTDESYDEKKESLLFEAVRLGSTPVLDVLLKKNAALLNKKNTNHETPLFEAVRADQSKVVEYLVKKGLSLTEKNKDGREPKDFASPVNDKMKAVLKKLSK